MSGPGRPTNAPPALPHTFILPQCEEQLGLMQAACRELHDCQPFSKVLQVGGILEQRCVTSVAPNSQGAAAHLAGPAAVAATATAVAAAPVSHLVVLLLCLVSHAVLDGAGQHLNQGTHRGAAAGFRLDTLLKLADVEGTDRKTSLLHFVVGQLLAEDPGLRGMAAQLANVRPTANMQVRIVGVGRLGGGNRQGGSSNVLTVGEVLMGRWAPASKSILPRRNAPISPISLSNTCTNTYPAPQLSAIKGMIGEVRLGLRVVHDEVVAAKMRDSEGSGSRHFSDIMAAFHAASCEDFRQLEVGGAGGCGAGRVGGWAACWHPLLGRCQRQAWVPGWRPAVRIGRSQGGLWCPSPLGPVAMHF